MQILIACAKIMTGVPPREIPSCTEPAFRREAHEHAIQLAEYSVAELQTVLKCNHTIAAENRERYQHFFDETMRVPAVFAYDGMVFRKLAPESLSDAALSYANAHLFIGSFLYGLLRPLDKVNRYRLEGDVVLPRNGVSMFQYWKPILTDRLIEQVKTDDGILLNLASSEFKNLFDWKRVAKELTVISPDFKVEKDGKLKNVTIYAKICRGAMTRYAIENQITRTEQLQAFSYEGFAHQNDWLFTLKA